MAGIEAEALSAYGLEPRILMENAAVAIQSWLECSSLLDASGGVCVVCGRGNNGGDGLALAARIAHSGGPAPRLVILSGSLSEECSFRLGLARKAGLEAAAWPEDRDRAMQAIRSAGVLIDAVSGTGLSSALRKEESDLAAVWNEARGRKIAIDLPSGFRPGMAAADPVFRADDTLCIGLEKECLYPSAFRSLAGRIHLLDVGIFPKALLAARPGDALILGPEDMKGALGRFPSDAYKTSRGSLAVFAGSVGGLGAARLCCEAAGRSGAGLVKLWIDAEAWTAAASGCGSLIVKGLGEGISPSRADIEEAAAADCLLAGPGWGRCPERISALESLLETARAVVLDADALYALKERSRALPARGAIITPHPGEAARLLSLKVGEVMENPGSCAARLSESYGCVTVLKGNVTWISGPRGEMRILDGEFPPLGTAGSGDVLAGIAAGLMARGSGAFDAACLAVLVHARIGRLAYLRRGYFLAQELCDHIHTAIREAEGGGDYAR
jgi:NAD(P)H-hydrate epimerase